MLGPSLHGEFLRHAVLQTVVPHAPDVDIEAALTSALEEGADDLTSVLKTIPQRSLLFFGKWHRGFSALVAPQKLTWLCFQMRLSLCALSCGYRIALKMH
jgi:hypothetical protein